MNSPMSVFEHFHCCKLGFQSKINNIMADSVDRGETARLDLHCLQRYQYWSVGMKWLKHREMYTSTPSLWIQRFSTIYIIHVFSYFSLNIYSNIVSID